MIDTSNRRRARPSILAVMHDRLAPPGLIGERIYARGGHDRTVLPHEGYDSVAPHESRGLPEAMDGFDGLVVLGGVMSANDDPTYPHFAPLLELIRGFHARRRPVLGVCLGAQLIARAFGGRVYPQGRTEFGFAPISLTGVGRRDPLLEGLGPTVRLMEAHEDALEPPAGAVLLATGEESHDQIFRLEETTYGFQCHFEVNADIARSWVRARAPAIAATDPAFFERFEAQLADHLAGAMAFARAVADRWIDLVEARRRADPR